MTDPRRRALLLVDLDDTRPLTIPDDVTILAMYDDPARYARTYVLAGARFERVPELAEPRRTTREELARPVPPPHPAL